MCKIKFFSQEESYNLCKGNTYIDPQTFAKIASLVDKKMFAGNFQMKGWSNEGFLYNLDEFDKNFVSTIKIKRNEKIFRYFTKTSAISGLFLFIKVNVEKGLIYFVDFGLDEEKIIFQTKSSKAEFLNLIK